MARMGLAKAPIGAFCRGCADGFYKMDDLGGWIHFEGEVFSCARMAESQSKGVKRLAVEVCNRLFQVWKGRRCKEALRNAPCTAIYGITHYGMPDVRTMNADLVRATGT